MNNKKYDGIEGFVKDLGCDVRECIDCGCLTPGGSTRCKRCAREVVDNEVPDINRSMFSDIVDRSTLERLEEQLWLTYLGYLEQAKAARTVRDFRVVDYEKRIVETQPYFSVRPLMKISLVKEWFK